MFLQTLEETDSRKKEVRSKKKKPENADYKVTVEGITEVKDKKGE